MIFARWALLPGGWVRNVRVSFADGRIQAVTEDAAARPGDQRVDALLPALSNLHSHAFQRAMAGMTEVRKGGRDSFWSWRELMYRFAATLTPEDIEAIASLVYMEMLEAGYAAAGEFHYLHHQPDGTPYDDPAELSARIAAAAGETGIGFTHLPVLYSYGGAGRRPVQTGQKRFWNDPDRFQRIVEGAKYHVGGLPDDCSVGIAPHSLRATCPDELAAVVAGNPEGPIHIHIAEQPKEVDDVSAWLGVRPVEWLLGNHVLDKRWCLVHATHMTGDETVRLASSGAVAGLCPITEANLGDGPFNGPEFLVAGGQFGIGSDSNVLISLTEELRTLEYSQRLRDLARNVLVKGEGSVGHALYEGAAIGGAQALGRPAGMIRVGALADLLAIDTSGPALCALRPEQLLDGLVFAARDDVVTDVWSAGRHVVMDGQHHARARIVDQYRQTMASLLDRI